MYIVAALLPDSTYLYSEIGNPNCALRNPFRHDIYDEFGDAIAQSECPEYIVEPYGFIVLVAQRKIAEAVDQGSHGNIASAILLSSQIVSIPFLHRAGFQGMVTEVESGVRAEALTCRVSGSKSRVLSSVPRVCATS